MSREEELITGIDRATHMALLAEGLRKNYGLDEVEAVLVSHLIYAHHWTVHKAVTMKSEDRLWIHGEMDHGGLSHHH